MNNCEIILGHKAFFNRTVFQACAAKTVTLKEAKKVSESMKLKFKSCIWAGIAYRTSRCEDFYEEIPKLGQKLLVLMSRMDVTNLTVGIGIWYSGEISAHDCNRMVLDRAMDIINYINSIKPEEIREKTPEKEFVLQEPEPIDSHKYVEFPEKPHPAPAPPFDKKTEKLRRRLEEIMNLFDETEAKSLHELTSHSLIGKVLELLFCVISNAQYSAMRVKNLFLKENVLDLMRKFEPNELKKKKIRELKKLIKEYSYLEPEKIEKISHSSVLILEYVKTVAEVLEEVPLPQPYEKSIVTIETEPELALKPIVYRALKKKKPKNGMFLDPSEAVIDNYYSITPLKITMKNEEIVHDSNSLGLIHQYSRSFALEKYSSVDLSTKIKGLHKKNNKFNQNSTEISSTSFELHPKNSKKNNFSPNISKKSIEFSKKSIGFSKKSIEASKKNIDPDEDIIDRVLKINSHRIDSWSALGIANSDNDMIRNINPSEIEKQPTTVLMKFAQLLKERRETHVLL